MKMIDVLNLMAEGKIKKGTKLEIVNDYNELYEYVYTIDEGKFCFLGEDGSSLCDEFRVDEGFLLEEAELIPPKEKKYLVKLHIRGLLTIRNYLNYYNDGIKQWNELGSKSGKGFYQTKFTEQELQSIKLVREFLEDMEGKYELVEVKENEGDNRHGN